MSEYYHGIYRGKVRANTDPLQRGRLQLDVAGVPGASNLSWASPCSPFGGKSGVGSFVLPPVGANVWVMFEGGSPRDPIWIGTFWSPDEPAPAQPAVEQTKMFKCDGLTVKLTDVPGAAMLEITMASGAKLVMGPTGIELDNGAGATIKLSGPQVNINNGGLEVI